MIAYFRGAPFPVCKHCRKRLNYYVLGLADEKHAHAECAGKAAAMEVFKRLKAARGN